MIEETQIPITPNGIEEINIATKMGFFINSSFRNKSLLPFANNNVWLMILRWSNISAKADSCKKIIQSSHLDVKRNNTSGRPTAAINTHTKKEQIETMIMYSR